MLYIRKTDPPAEVVRQISKIKGMPEWRRIQEGDTSSLRAKFNELDKAALRAALLPDQSYLCAYCMRKIQNGDNTVIEHWYPLSKDKNAALDYQNMLAVCDGGTKNSKNGILCCDKAKAEQEITITPLKKGHMKKIAYDKNGFIRIEPGDKVFEHDIEVLKLNGYWKNGKFKADTATGLVKGRSDAYKRCERFIRKLDREKKCTSSQLKKKIDEIENAEQKPEFAGVLLYFLDKKYQTLLKRGL